MKKIADWIADVVENPTDEARLDKIAGAGAGALREVPGARHRALMSGASRAHVRHGGACYAWSSSAL